MARPQITASIERSFATPNKITRATVVKWFAIMAVVGFLLRIVYAGHLFGDDGLWFPAAEQMLRGKTLYREIYFDKPPGLAYIYAGLFWLFGPHIVVIRILTVAYSVAISGVLYVFASKLYGERVGLLAAALFAFFSTNPINNHVQGLHTDFLIVLPGSASAYLFTRACYERRMLYAFFGGVLAGVATQTNPKGLFALLFFAILLFFAARWFEADPGEARVSSPANLDRRQSMEIPADQTRGAPRFRMAAKLFGVALAGLVAGNLPFLVYIASTNALGDYWSDVWRWGSAYASYYPASRLVTRGVPLTAQYLVLNNTLLVGLCFVIAITYRRLRSTAGAESSPDRAIRCELRPDITLLVWFAVSLAGLAVGYRFYSQYFFQVLPSLCVLGARGLTGISSALTQSSARMRRVAVTILAIGFLFTLVRFHTRTATLSFDWLRGTKSATNARFFQMNHDQRMAAAVVRDLPGGAEGADRFDVEAMRPAGGASRTEVGSSDYLFIWGSSGNVYYWSGLIPASRHLSAQPLTGVPADEHHNGGSRTIIDPSETAAARSELAAVLQQVHPKYILDELGFYSYELSIQNYPELRELMNGYDNLGATGGFLVYRWKGEGGATPGASGVK